MPTRLVLSMIVGVAIASPTIAAEKPARIFVVNNPDAGVPVFANDITDRPYEVIGPVTAHVRKATVFSHAASQAKIYRELWERAAKRGADAVVNASYGDSHITAASWGSTTATGTAIRFTAPGTAH